MRRKKGQSTLEWSALLAVIVAALLATSVYMKRALQGRIRGLADSVGEQYSPTRMNSSVTTSINSNTTVDTTVEKSGTLDAKSLTTTITNETNARTGYEEVLNYNQETLF